MSELHPVRAGHTVLSHTAEKSVRMRASACVMGALTADAAALPLHWVYDTEAIRAAVASAASADGSSGPEFYEGAVSKYHGARKVGDCTQLGETALVALRSLSPAGRDWNAQAFAHAHYDTFGPGGSYHGYCDKATRQTIMNFMSQQKDLQEMGSAAASVDEYGMTPYGGYALGQVLSGTLTGEELAAAAETAVRGACPGVTLAGLTWVREVAGRADAAKRAPLGSVDNQTPAMAQIPVIAARYAGHKEYLHMVTEGIRSTSNADESITWGVWCARVLEAVLLGMKPADAIQHNLRHLEQPFRAAVESAVKAAADEPDLYKGTSRFGVACPLANAVPCSVYLLMRHGGNPDYVTLVRENILAGGDSAGRALFLGAVSGAVHGIDTPTGIPAAWVAKLSCKDEALKLVDHIHEAVTQDMVTDHIEVHRAH